MQYAFRMFSSKARRDEKFAFLSGIAAFAVLFFGVFSPAAAQSYGTGLSLLPPQEYEALPAVPRFRAFLPPSADLSEWFPAVGNQGQQGSCTAWSTTYYMRSYYVNRQSGSAVRAASLSPAFVYNQLARRGAQCKEGLVIGRALDFLKTRGAPPFASFPYAQGDCEAQPDIAVDRLAGNFRISDWKRLDKGKLDDVKGELASGNPVVIGMLLPPSFMKFKGDANYDDVVQSPDAHAMAVVGYDDSRRAFRLINSWGTAWGDNGYAWVSYRAFQADVREAYAARVANAPPPAPLPSPPKPIVVVVVEPPKPVPVIIPEPPKPAPVVVDPPKPLPPSPVPVVVVEPPRPVPPNPAPVVVELPKPAPVIVQPPKPVPVIVQPPKPAPNLGDIERRLTAMAKEMRCADVRANVVGGQLSVSGFVGEEADALKLRDVLAAAGASGKFNVQHRPWPQCEALLTLARPLDEQVGLTINAAKSRLREGEALSFQVTTPEYAAYLYVSYLQADGQVVHLRRYADQGNRPLPPRTSLMMGGKGEYVVSGPSFGAESIFVVASAIPLLALDRPQIETEREYLTEFRLAILGQQQAKGKVAAVFLPLTTTK